MAEELPNVQALLIELLELTEEDRLMPVDILVNLHRTQLREPFQRFAEWTVWTKDHDEVGRRVQVMLNDTYPSLKAGRKFYESRELFDELGLQEHNGTALEIRHLRKLWVGVQASDNTKSIMDTLLRDAARDWVAYDPLVRLYALTMPVVSPRSSCLRVLEIELQVDPAVREMILELAERL